MSYYSNAFDMVRKPNIFKDRSETVFSSIFQEQIQKNETKPDLPTYLNYYYYFLYIYTTSFSFSKCPSNLNLADLWNSVLEERGRMRKLLPGTCFM